MSQRPTAGRRKEEPNQLTPSTVNRYALNAQLSEGIIICKEKDFGPQMTSYIGPHLSKRGMSRVTVRVGTSCDRTLTTMAHSKTRALVESSNVLLHTYLNNWSFMETACPSFR